MILRVSSSGVSGRNGGGKSTVIACLDVLLCSIIVSDEQPGPDPVADKEQGGSKDDEQIAAHARLTALGEGIELELWCRSVIARLGVTVKMLVANVLVSHDYRRFQEVKCKLQGSNLLELGSGLKRGRWGSRSE